MVKIVFYPHDITYKIHNGVGVIYLYGRDKSGKVVCAKDSSYKAYLFVAGSKKSDFDGYETKNVKKKVLGVETDLVQVFTTNPAELLDMREKFKKHGSVYEYDINFGRKYLIDKGLSLYGAVEFDGELVSSEIVSTYEVKMIKQKDMKAGKLKVMAFDLETYTNGVYAINMEKNPILMASFYMDGYKKVITWKKFSTKHKYIEFVSSEKELIERCVSILLEKKPDVLVGYFSDGFDMPYLLYRAEKFGVKFNAGLDGSLMHSRKSKDESVYSLVGITHIDLFKFVKNVVSKVVPFDSVSLNTLCKYYLNSQKKDVDIEQIGNAWDKTDSKMLEEFAVYNLIDSELTCKLGVKLLDNIDQFVKVIGFSRFDITRMGFSQLVESFIMRKTCEYDEIIVERPHNDQISDRLKESFTGGYVFSPNPGIYKKIKVFDFKSLYPSIIISHNLGPETVKVAKNKDGFVVEKRSSFLASILKELLDARAKSKDVENSTLKMLANSFYGYLGFFGARWYSIVAAKAAAHLGRQYIQKVIDGANENKLDVIYGDTDSVFLLGELSKCKKYVSSVNKKLPLPMKLEFDDEYISGIFVGSRTGEKGAKKKYALVKNGELVIRGFESVRRDWSQIAREVQTEVLKLILIKDDVDAAALFVKKIVSDVKKGKISNDKFVIKTILQKDLDSYVASSPHIVIGRQLKSKGFDIKAGSKIQYIVAKGSGLVRDRAKLVNEVSDGGYDGDYYVENQIVPAVLRIFEAAGVEILDYLK